MTVNELDAPDYLRPGIRQINETLADLRTTRIRFARAGAEARDDGPRERPDPVARTRDVATAPDAPPELARVAKAVADGRTTWAAIASGQAEDLPEMVALRERAEEIRELLASGQVDLADVMWKSAPVELPLEPPVAAVEEDDDEPRDSFMVRVVNPTPPGVRQTWRRRY